MDALSNDPRLSQAAADLAVDSRALDSLKRDAAHDPRGAIRKAAQQFEALFMQMVLKSMRDATPKSGMLDSSANEMYTGMLDQQLAGKIAATGTGLADMIAKQLTRYIKSPRDGSADAAAPANAPPAGSGSAAAVAPSAPPAASDQHSFVSKLWDHAMSAASATGLPARFILGQAALESGWGKQEIRGADGAPSYNLFGIKAGANWKGRTVDVATTEYVNGVAQKKVQTFRAYSSYAESFLDWAQQMVRNPRYAGVLASAGNAPDGGGFAAALQRAGYATDPAYASKLTQVIRSAASLRSSA